MRGGVLPDRTSALADGGIRGRSRVYVRNVYSNFSGAFLAVTGASAALILSIVEFAVGAI